MALLRREEVVDAGGGSPPRPAEKHPLRVLQITARFCVGGAERLIANLTRHLRDGGMEVAAVSLYPPSDSHIEKELRRAGVELFFLRKHPGLDLGVVVRLAELFERFRPDVVHTHGYVLRYILPALARWPCRVVHTMHTLAEYEVDLPGRVVQYFAFRSPGVVSVAIGSAVADSLRRLYGVDPSYTVNNGIPVEHYTPRPGDREAIRQELGIDAAAPVFAAVGRVTDLKNHELLIAGTASPRLRAAGGHLLIAGDGPARAGLERLARELAVGDRVHFLGMRSDVRRILAASDVFALSSWWEGNPLSVMEAMASGKPVIATRVGCLPELVDEATGELVPPRDAAAIERAMCRFAEDPALVRAKGAAAARVALERFDDRVMARQYEAIYRRRSPLQA